jgi:uncharacterized hydrophobic protein (TIGR00271 family)
MQTPRIIAELPLDELVEAWTMTKNSLFARAGDYFKSLRVSPERAEVVFKIVSDGSVPHLGYYALISAATVIASLGLIQNSGPVVIGAMLVSPLMTPIFGMALGIIRGNTSLFVKALQAEFGGVALAILFGMIFGALPLMTELTPEISSRLQPNLLDLLVAVFAGFAGTWAMVDERISPVLPGVAISTAIIPPLAACGMCLSQGAFEGAQGAFLLFFANFLAILMISSLIFWRVGLAAESVGPSRKSLRHSFFVTGVLLVIVGFLLTNSLVKMLELRRRTEIGRDVLRQSEATHPVYSIVGLKHREFHGKIKFLATVRTSRSLSPDKVAQLQKEMSKLMGMPVELTVSCLISHEVASTGSIDILTEQGLDGISLGKPHHPDVRVVRVAEQALRDALRGLANSWLVDVDLTHVKKQPVIVATMLTHRRMLPHEVKVLEVLINRRLGEPKVMLVVRSQIAYDVTSHGRILLGKLTFDPDNEEEGKMVRLVSESVSKLGKLFVSNVDGVWDKDHWELYAEIQGERVISESEVKQIEQHVAEKIMKPVKLRAWSRAELVVTDQRSYETGKFLESQRGKSIFLMDQEAIEQRIKELSNPQ